ncbi:Acireductone dioxygenase [Gloeophyllum trabeum ATCC 11539]|uniref:Acireductone dioxygenase n=1 Tax=Gloeophyllum trabeum (strain ATCC 11539 / FP-39264 / Madison 617) TaxID=670483 RepID=S7RMT8_GLOTA|nr:Acireductone dioxygenase [Gloeophyllum trabeum ATCC 11539]EPQ53994.1 Acireductone dioxygenase [Gloeophyllum trabeum ATCC 11539]
MRAYYFDNVPGDQRLPHDSGKSVLLEKLSALGVHYWSIPVSPSGEPDEEAVDRIARERDYKNRDVIDVSRQGLGAAYESKIKMFFEEHMHEDEEIRYILAGSGFFDVREHPTDNWIRIAMHPGDMIVLPAGIYHRFTLDEADRIRAMRLFKDEPKWTPYNRGHETDANPIRGEYLRAIGVGA